MKKFILTLAVTSLFLSSIANADVDKEALKKKLSERMPSLTVEGINPSPIKGLYEILVGADIYYVSEDGRYLVQGRMFDLVDKKDLTEEKLAVAKAKLINTVSADQMITFKAPMQKYVISIFTDIDCGYCRKLHSEIDQYMAEGITINYLFFPRAGVNSDSYKKAVSVWCADDRNAALTASKSGSNPPPEKTCENPVDEHMALGDALGVRGTPMMISPKGMVYPGYMPAKKLAEALSQENK
ncbi:thiol:disulfide interchange protein DsbC [Bathymodiolus platifrons methanotrophic gill symbiont]|uniref:DsbC family protein n=1 Tax=Bathymodiolus platifrons methanotrophic gill symbiont TaxID=113268 RepID=UPI000B41264E|nr:DsbC family protein [Bathymodiolus platifrons methanotrophic gill symbiont]MCK5869368.1 DsbC family protein [Methyloprofundus sp.]TXK95052.1 disulfide bond formation protein DsbC [Methylococcaceae bacterium CS4]TXK96100.1 disulfide bond formation protein DsbC [Methylococcaceae bacterium CS5]TXL06121.1 disulfide bond formation protein DsbC [Methylococcaceae bacterium CS3]TXL08271.1 disulfide bond formation protein DsbC [Methylococcaceae bacterium CS1]TXL10044.1 disulfide bond formation prot